MLVATSQGGIQALSRSYFAKLVPKESANEFFGFYNIFGKFAAIMYPVLVGVTTQLTGKTNAGVLSIIVLFIIGGFLLTRVPKIIHPLHHLVQRLKRYKKRSSSHKKRIFLFLKVRLIMNDSTACTKIIYQQLFLILQLNGMLTLNLDHIYYSQLHLSFV